MKKILITGANSYIGTSFESYIFTNYPDDYLIDTIDMIDGSWREKSFAGYDVVFHVAGIAHQKETKQNSHLYYKVNKDLAVDVAKKAREDGVAQFIFLSSMSVYGKEQGVITRETTPAPKSHYGISKWQAEQEIELLSDEKFKVCIIRPPMVYGKGCKGNFQSVVKIVRKFPIFPRVENKRRMIYIDNLSSFVKRCIDFDFSGLYFPQNDEYMSTMDLARGISEGLDKKILFEYFTGIGITILRLFNPTVKKAFGSLVYEYGMDGQKDYCVISNAESVKESVKL